MAEGTFKTVPSLFAQLYTIHGLAGGVYPFLDGPLLPCIYVLLPGKSSFYYRKMWKIIKDLCPNQRRRQLVKSGGAREGPACLEEGPNTPGIWTKI